MPPSDATDQYPSAVDGTAVTAAAAALPASSRPAPYTLSKPAAPRSAAVRSRRLATSPEVRAGLTARMRAAAPGPRTGRAPRAPDPHRQALRVPPEAGQPRAVIGGCGDDSGSGRAVSFEVGVASRQRLIVEGVVSGSQLPGQLRMGGVD